MAQTEGLEATSDLEIVAQTVRYARAAPAGTRAKAILTRLKADFPTVDPKRILSCMSQAAEIMLEQHN